jgi:pimeloyl-ACP methyl ester carboxylesterase
MPTNDFADPPERLNAPDGETAPAPVSQTARPADAGAENNTNVRSSLRIARGLFPILEHAAPGLAGRWAARLFFTPPRERPRRSAREWPEAVAPASQFEVPLGPARLAAWRWGAGPAVLLVHGWGSRGRHLAPFIRPLLDAGCSVVTFDAPAHGDSPGTRTTMPQMAAAIGAVASSAGPLHGLIAHSIGGPAATLAFRDGLRVERAVFLAPAASPEEYTRTFAGRLALGPRTLGIMRARIERRIGMRWAELEVPHLARGLAVALLLVHDEDDADVSWGESARIAEAWPGAVHVSTRGLGHRRILRDPQVVARAVAFVAGSGERPPADDARADTDGACAREGCANRASEWDSSRRLCASCALERDLYEPGLRWAAAG